MYNVKLNNNILTIHQYKGHMSYYMFYNELNLNIMNNLLKDIIHNYRLHLLYFRNILSNNLKHMYNLFPKRS